MYPIGIAIREITSVKVPVSASVTNPIEIDRGSNLVVEESNSRTVDEPKRNRMNVQMVQPRRFRLLCEVPASLDNPAQDQIFLFEGYLGNLGPDPTIRR